MEQIRTVTTGTVTFGESELALIAGPCVIESADHAKCMAEHLQSLTNSLGMPFLFKASYDKANRSSLGGFRGPGLEEGLRILNDIKLQCGVGIVTDIHTPAEAAAVSEVADILQIPAFLSRQTDLLVAAAATGKTVNIKKGQFLSPTDMGNAVAKASAGGNRNLLLTERGTFFGYNNLVVDMRSLPLMREYAPVIFDATHSVQRPGGQGTCSGGDREMATVLARAATACGIDGLFLEVHDDPDSALCDGPNMIPLAELESLLRTLQEIHTTTKNATHR